jgi:Multicopper oxidase
LFLQHWHGIDQHTTNWADGPAFVTQCPIIPGHSFLYDFSVPDQAGTFWYHSHIGTQYCDGLRGAFVVYDPQDPFRNLYDVDDGSFKVPFIVCCLIYSFRRPRNQRALSLHWPTGTVLPMTNHVDPLMILNLLKVPLSLERWSTDRVSSDVSTPQCLETHCRVVKHPERYTYQWSWPISQWSEFYSYGRQCCQGLAVGVNHSDL